MCNLYSQTKGQQAIIAATRAMQDRTGNLPPLPGIFPDYGAPIVRDGRDGRELVLARWGMPSPLFALKGKKTDPGVTNIRNVGSPHWRRWLGPESRCLVPFTSFSENELSPGGSKQPIRFAFDEDRPLEFFAGIWMRWTSIRKVREGEVTADLFGFLTTEPNAEIAVFPPAGGGIPAPVWDSSSDPSSISTGLWASSAEIVSWIFVSSTVKLRTTFPADTLRS
jgi:putative SOS response-associated peptidase YedK